MRTNVEIDDELLSDYMAESGLTTKRQAIDTALRTSLALKRQERIRALRGKIQWIGDLDDMRTSKHIPADE